MLMEALLGAILVPIGMAIVGAVYRARQPMWDRMAPQGCGMLAAAVAVYLVLAFLIGIVAKLT